MEKKGKEKALNTKLCFNLLKIEQIDGPYMVWRQSMPLTIFNCSTERWSSAYLHFGLDHLGYRLIYTALPTLYAHYS